jgi:hypothetical protein
MVVVASDPTAGLRAAHSKRNFSAIPTHLPRCIDRLVCDAQQPHICLLNNNSMYQLTQLLYGCASPTPPWAKPLSVGCITDSSKVSCSHTQRPELSPQVTMTKRPRSTPLCPQAAGFLLFRGAGWEGGKIIEEPCFRVGSIYTCNTVYIYTFCYILDRAVALALTPVNSKTIMITQFFV